jgi:hypothetical protein
MFTTANPNGVGPASGQTKTVTIDSPKVFVLTVNITNALASANPGVVLNLLDGAPTVVRDGRFQGHGVTHARLHGWGFEAAHGHGPRRRCPGSVTGTGEYKRGVRVGAASNFSPTF